MTTSASFSSSSSTGAVLQQQRPVPPPPPLQGVYPILVTPFHNDTKESLDLESFRRSLTFMIHSGSCRGVTITGVLGESNRMTDSEREQLLRVAKATIQEETSTSNKHQDDKQHDFHLCVGTSFSGTAATVALSEMAQELGADSVMVTPSKDGPSQPADNDIVELYARISEACGPNVGIVLQDHPSSTGVFMSLELMARIVAEIPSVICIKLESLPTVNRLSGLKKAAAAHCNHNHHNILDNNCSILTGLGALYAGYDLEQGMTSGFMTGFAFPEILKAMLDAAHVEDYPRVHELYQQFLPLIVLEQSPGSGLAIRKEIYKLRGLIDCAHVRHPGKNISPTLVTTLHKQLERSFPPGTDLTKPLPPEFFLP